MMVLPSSSLYRRRGRRTKITKTTIRCLLLIVAVGAILTVRSLIKSLTMIPSSTSSLPPPSSAEYSSEKVLNKKEWKSISTTPPSSPVNKNNKRQIINGWERLKPSHGGTVFGEEIDSFTTGRSCHWKEAGIFGKFLSWIFFFSRSSYSGEWICRDCGDADDGERKVSSWSECPVMNRRGKCPPFRFQGWEDPKPRLASTYDYKSSVPASIRLITSYGVGKFRTIEYEQPECHLTYPCFDMDKCTIIAANNTSRRELIWPLQIFVYPGIARQDVDQLLQNSKVATTSLQIVDDPSRACLLITHFDDLEKSKASTSWNMGRNHYVYGVTKPIEEGVHYDMASIGSVVLTEAQIRRGYDIALPLPALWSDTSSQNLDLHRQRRWLVSFKGSVQDTLQPYYQHRWLAAEYLHRDTDVAIDVQCKHKTLLGDLITFAPYDNPSQSDFDDLMVNSTFAFCPGGSHVTSFRFTEVLSTGSIPVLLPEIVTPFYPELDWSGCVLRVSQARIVDLPRILRAISKDEIRARQTECWRLYQLIRERNVDTKKSSKIGQGFLSTALKVWMVRIEKQNYEIQQQHKLLSLSW